MTEILVAKVLINQIADRGILENIQDAEFKVFSQCGEDGIIQYLIRQANVTPELHTFIEFGVGNYQESSTRFLLQNNNWRGLILDSNPVIETVKNRRHHWLHELQVVCSHIDRDNIDSLISDAGFSGPIGLLSIDLDGNDYWVWEAITAVDPIIVVVEYNSLWGGERALAIPYDPKFNRSDAHYSDLYFGCSIGALEKLGARKGYSLVGSNTTGHNAFFVKTSHLGSIPIVGAIEAHVTSRFRESRDQAGKYNWVSDHRDRLIVVKDMPLLNLETNQLMRVSDI